MKFKLDENLGRAAAAVLLEGEIRSWDRRSARTQSRREKLSGSIASPVGDVNTSSTRIVPLRIARAYSLR